MNYNQKLISGFEENLNQSIPYRRKYIKENENLKKLIFSIFYSNKINNLFSNKNYLSNTNCRQIQLSKSLKIVGGNFFYPIKENIRIEKSEGDGLCCKYLGDNQISKMNSAMIKAEQLKMKRLNKIDLDSETSSDDNGSFYNARNEKYNDFKIILGSQGEGPEHSFILSKSKKIPDDIITNSFIIKILKLVTKYEDINKTTLINKVKPIIFTFYPNANFIDLHLIRLLNRYIKLNQEFFHFSCKKEEEHNMDNIIGTYLQLYCSICFIYDCQVHKVKEKSFGIKEAFSINNLANTYVQMFKVSLLNYTTPEHNEYQNMDNIIKIYNLIINNSKENQQYLKFKKNLKSIPPNNLDVCSISCFKNTSTGQFFKMINSINLMNSKEAEIIDMYIDRLFHIFLFDPCKIYNSTKNIIFNDSDQFIKSNITCGYICVKLLIKYNFNNLKSSFINTEGFKPRLKKQSANHISNFRLKNITHLTKNNKVLEFTPCLHLTDQICDDSCACAKRGFCEKFCICNKNLCKNRFYGCRCSTNCLTSACPCYAAGRECDEDLCGNCRFESATETIVQGNRSIKIFCKDYYSKNNKCWNKVCKSGYSAKLSISKSDISGWGLFALQRIIKSQLIREYTGEILTDDECREREIWNCLEETTYMFKQNEENSIDSKFIGNCTRFANHTKDTNRLNAYPKIIFSEGKHKICLLALRDIEIGEEILFDYDGQDILCDKFDWISGDKRASISNPSDKFPKKSLKTSKNKNVTHSKNSKYQESIDCYIKRENLDVINLNNQNKKYLGEKRISNDILYIDLENENNFRLPFHLNYVQHHDQHSSTSSKIIIKNKKF